MVNTYQPQTQHDFVTYVKKYRQRRAFYCRRFSTLGGIFSTSRSAGTVPSHQNVRPPKWSFFCFSFPPKWSEQNDRQMSWNDRVRGNFEVSHQNDRASSGTKLPTKMIERKIVPTKMIASQPHVTLIVITLHQHKPCTSLVYVGF